MRDVVLFVLQLDRVIEKTANMRYVVHNIEKLSATYLYVGYVWKQATDSLVHGVAANNGAICDHLGTPATLGTQSERSKTNTEVPIAVLRSFSPSSPELCGC